MGSPKFSGFKALNDDNSVTSCNHTSHCCKMSGGIASPHPQFLLQSSCCSILADRVTGDRNPRGSHTELVVDNIPRRVRDCCLTSILNLNESDSTHQSRPKALSMGSFIYPDQALLDPLPSDFQQCSAALNDVLLTHFSKPNPPLSQRALSSLTCCFAAFSELKLSKQSST